MTTSTKTIDVRPWNDPRRGREFPMIDIATRAEPTDPTSQISAVDVWEKSRNGTVNRVRIVEESPMPYADALAIAIDIARRRGVQAVYARNIPG